MIFYLIMGDRINGEIQKFIMVAVTEEDMKVIEPALQRIIRNGLNPSFGIQLIRREE